MVLRAVKGRAQARAASGFIPLTVPARHDRGMLVGTKGVPTVSTTPPAGRTKGCRKKIANDPRLENGKTTLKPD
jgi:hypothetical protein